MSVEELEKAVSELPREDLTRFFSWFQNYMAEEWDRQIEKDLNAGRLDKLIEEAKDDIAAGRYRAMVLDRHARSIR